MQLTNDELEKFIGGQIEVQNQNEGYIYRGEIGTINVENNEFKVKCVWLGKGEGYPPLPTSWIKDDQLDYSASLEIYSVSDIGPGTEGSNRLCLQSNIVGEIVVLFPPDGSKLDRAKVKGLELVSV